MTSVSTANPETPAAAPQQCCWVCGSSRADRWKARSLERPLEPDDLAITDKRYGLTLGLFRCRECGFIFADGADLRELVALYSSLDDPGYIDTLEPRTLQMRWLMSSALAARPQAKTMLDVGAGAGLLVKEGKARGLDAVGVEPSRALVQAGIEKFQVQLHAGEYPHPALAGRTFDLVFLIDVIEHVADPVGLLKHLAAALAPGGALVLVTPDVRSLCAHLPGQRWWHFRLAHVGYFDRQTLGKAAAAAGLRPVRFFRAKWFFRVRYLAQRAGEYLPVGWFNRLAEKIPPLRWLYERTIPLNLFDSWAVILEADK